MIFGDLIFNSVEHGRYHSDGKLGRISGWKPNEIHET